MRARTSPAPGMERRAYTVNEAAQALALGRNTVRTLIAAGKLHAIYAGSRVIVPVTAIDRFLAGGDGGEQSERAV